MNAQRCRFGSDETSGIVGRAKTRLLKELNRLGNVAPGEARALAWAFLYHFLLLCSYYMIRPIRDEMGVAGGVENLQWLFLGTFAAMMAIVPVFGWLTSRLPRKRFLPYAYLFFIANLLGFFALFRSGVSYAYVARAFFIWVSVFNLFVVSVFWSFMTDIFSDAQSKRLFGVVAAGGSAGAIAGPAIAAVLVQVIGVNWLLPMSAGSLALALLCIRRLVAWESTQQAHEGPTDLSHASRDETPLGGSVWAGLHLVLKSPYLLGICGLILLYTTLSTFSTFSKPDRPRRLWGSDRSHHGFCRDGFGGERPHAAVSSISYRTHRTEVWFTVGVGRHPFVLSRRVWGSCLCTGAGGVCGGSSLAAGRELCAHEAGTRNAVRGAGS